MKHPKILLAMLTATALAIPALAQQGPPTARPATPAAETAEAKRPDVAEKRARFERLRARVLRKRAGLDDREAEKVVALLEGEVAKRQAIRDRMREARRELKELFRSDSDDQEAWAAALDKMNEARNDMQALRSAQYEQLSTILPPKKRAMLLRTMHQVRGKMGNRGRGKARGAPRRGRDQAPPRGPRRGPGPRGKGPPGR